MNSTSSSARASVDLLASIPDSSLLLGPTGHTTARGLEVEESVPPPLPTTSHRSNPRAADVPRPLKTSLVA